jgi:hypothetical protein
LKREKLLIKMQDYYQDQPNLSAYVQVLENRADESCERLANGSLSFSYVDIPNCVQKTFEGYIQWRDARGSLASISLMPVNQSAQIGTPGTSYVR